MRRGESGRRAVKVGRPGFELGSEQDRRTETKCRFFILCQFSQVINVRIERAKDRKILGLESCLEII